MPSIQVDGCTSIVDMSMNSQQEILIISEERKVSKLRIDDGDNACTPHLVEMDLITSPSEIHNAKLIRYGGEESSDDYGRVYWIERDTKKLMSQKINIFN